MTGHPIRRPDLIEAALAHATGTTVSGPMPTRDVHPDGQRLARDAVHHATTLVRTIRAYGRHAVALATDSRDRDELVAIVTVLAAMCPPDTDPRIALAWAEITPARWPDSVVIRERARYTSGARDTVATQAAHEFNRRAAS
jgi:hypothetical protein